MKFATHVVLFGQDKWIMRNLENAYPHVDRIYIAYSEKPWTYNPVARDKYKNTFDLEIIRQSKFMDKITIIEGEWPTEEAQRNACVDAANKDGMDIMIVHDADEFYFHDAFEKIKKFIEVNPNTELFKIGWYCFWKSFDTVLLSRDRHWITGYPEFAINLKRGIRFISKRRPNNGKQPNQITTIPAEIGECYHGSYVLTNEELLQKINTWGHAMDFNKEKWYKEKWLEWDKNPIGNLHLVTPEDWSMAVSFRGNPLPEVIADLAKKS